MDGLMQQEQSGQGGMAAKRACHCACPGLSRGRGQFGKQFPRRRQIALGQTPGKIGRRQAGRVKNNGIEFPGNPKRRAFDEFIFMIPKHAAGAQAIRASIAALRHLPLDNQMKKVARRRIGDKGFARNRALQKKHPADFRNRISKIAARPGLMRIAHLISKTANDESNGSS